MENTAQLATMNAAELRLFAAKLMTEIADTQRDNHLKQLKIDQLTHEMAVLKRLKFAAQSEQLSAQQRSLFEETLDADLEAIALELKALQRKDERQAPKQQPKRRPLPEHLPRTEVRHDPASTTCACGCALQRIGEDVSEKLDYSPGVFRVERHIRGKWVCRTCEQIHQAPMPPTVIDKGIPTPRLLAHILVSKYLDHLPLYRLSGIYGREGVPIPESTLAQWVGICGFNVQPLVDALHERMLTRPVLHADETPVAMLDPGHGKTHTAYMWAYGTTPYDPMQAVVYEFCEGRAGKHVRRFLEGWSGQLVCDGYSGYTALFKGTIIEVGCLAHYPESRFILSDACVARQFPPPLQRLLDINSSTLVRAACHPFSSRDVLYTVHRVIHATPEVGHEARSGLGSAIGRSRTRMASEPLHPKKLGRRLPAMD